MAMFFTEIDIKDIPEDVIFKPSRESSNCSEGVSNASYLNEEGHIVHIRRVNDRNKGKAGRSKYYVIEYNDN